MILAIYCAGGLGREVLELARAIGKWEQIVFVDDVTDRAEIHGTHVYRFDDVSSLCGQVEFVISNGEPAARKTLYMKVKSSGYPFASVVHPACNISETAQTGQGCILFPCRLYLSAYIGNNVLIEGGVNIGYDAVIGSHSLVNSMAFIGGYTWIGERVYIAPGALLRDRISVGDDAIVGMGAVVVRNVAAEAVVAGNPAKEIGKNMEKKVFKGHFHNEGGVTGNQCSLSPRHDGSRRNAAWMNAAICLLCAA